MSRENDRALRFYNEVLGLEHLHYGLWNEAEPLTLENMRAAQQRYEDFLVERLPAGARRVLDVGCGTASLCRRMLELGREAEGLSPDDTQERHFRETLRAPFYRCRFEDFGPPHRYDCIIMSESCQYIPMDRLFDKVEACLVPGGHLLVFDYFVLESATGRLAKSGHPYERFMKTAAERTWALRESVDITERAARTLDLAEDFAQRALRAGDILTEKFRSQRPRLSRLLFRLARKKWQKLESQRVLIDAEAFKTHKRYAFFHYQIGTPSSS